VVVVEIWAYGSTRTRKMECKEWISYEGHIGVRQVNYIKMAIRSFDCISIGTDIRITVNLTGWRATLGYLRLRQYC